MLDESEGNTVKRDGYADRLQCPTRAMVFHAPYPLQDDPSVASALRPMKMRQAFTALGFTVIDVTGHARERKEKINILRQQMDAGLHIEFVYSESATIPNSFTEPRHLPLHLLLDRAFFKSMRARGIPVGVYYRDIYWAFPEYEKSVGRFIAAPMRMLYRWDIDAYSRYLSTLFVPSLEMAEFIPQKLLCSVAALPPAADFVGREVNSLEPGRELELLFVGGINHDHYDLRLLLEVIRNRPGVHLTLCVREDEWEKIGPDYLDVLGRNVEVVHRTSSELDDLYKRAHICLLYLPPGGYRQFAVPVKLYEYLGNCRPVLVSKPSFAAEVVEDAGVGWASEYSSDALEGFLEYVRENPGDLNIKAEAAMLFGAANRWIDRAEQACTELSRDSGRLEQGSSIEAAKNEKMQVTIASRVFLPEPTAASFRLGAVSKALGKRNAKVTVLTARPLGNQNSKAQAQGVSVRSAPVLRDKQGYLRGYIPYMSFDLPLFWRLLHSPHADVILVEPPPTTGVVVRMVSKLKGSPYVWYAADIWSDAAEIAGSSQVVVKVLRAMERFALRGASGIIAVSEGVAKRAQELGGQNLEIVPNGIDTDVYQPSAKKLSELELSRIGLGSSPYLIYAGTASEWQGATIFADAMEAVLHTHPNAQLVYIGQGSEWEKIHTIAAKLSAKHGRTIILQLQAAEPDTVARLLVGSNGALVSIVPDTGYDFAYPTKILAALSSGIPVLYAGKGPAARDIERYSLGIAVEYTHDAVVRGMNQLLGMTMKESDRQALRNWVVANRSLESTGEQVAELLKSVATVSRGGGKVKTELGGVEETNDKVSMGKTHHLARIRVTVVTPWYPNEGNSVEGIFVHKDVKTMKDSGLKVRVVFLDRGLRTGQVKRERRDGIRVLRLGMNPSSPKSVAASLPALRDALRDTDVVHSHAISSLPPVALAHRNKPWVHTEHWSALSSPETLPPLLRLARPVFASMLRLPDVVIAVSDRGASPIRDFRGSKPLELVPCLVASPTNVLPFRESRISVDGSPTVRLVSVGGLIDRKNPQLAVRALSSLKNRGYNATLRWVGDGPQRADLVNLAKELDVDAQFIGERSPQGVEEELADADIYLGPTKGDNFFVSVAESLVNGRPVCVSDRGGHIEYVDTRYSEIVASQDPDAYADAVIRIIDRMDSFTAQDVAASVDQRFSPSTIAAHLTRIYRQVL